MSEANVLDKYHAPTDGRHFLGPRMASASIPWRKVQVLSVSIRLFLG